MNTKLIALIFFLNVCGVISSLAQGTGVRSEYLKDEKSTKVETNMPYVGNTTDQFVGIQFVGKYKGDKPVTAPTIEISIFSFSKVPAFKSDKNRTLVIIANGVETNVGTLALTTYK